MLECEAQLILVAKENGQTKKHTQKNKKKEYGQRALQSRATDSRDIDVHNLPGISRRAHLFFFLLFFFIRWSPHLKTPLILQIYY